MGKKLDFRKKIADFYHDPEMDNKVDEFLSKVLEKIFKICSWVTVTGTLIFAYKKYPNISTFWYLYQLFIILLTFYCGHEVKIILIKLISFFLNTKDNIYLIIKDNIYLSIIVVFLPAIAIYSFEKIFLFKIVDTISKNQNISCSSGSVNASRK